MSAQDDIVDRMFARMRERVADQLARRVPEMLAPAPDGERHEAACERVRNKVAEIIGQAAIAAEHDIRQEFAGERPYINRVSWRSLAERDARIRREALAGATVRDIARRHCVGVATVNRILRRG